MKNKYKYEDMMKDVSKHNFMVIQSSDDSIEAVGWFFDYFFDDIKKLKHLKIIYCNRFKKSYDLMLKYIPSSVETLQLFDNQYDLGSRQSTNYLNNYNYFSNNLKYLVILIKLYVMHDKNKYQFSSNEKKRENIHNKQLFCYFPSSLYSFDFKNTHFNNFKNTINNLPNSLRNIKTNEFYIHIPCNIVYFKTTNKMFIGKKNKLGIFCDELSIQGKLEMKYNNNTSCDINCIATNKFKHEFEIYEGSYYNRVFSGKIHHIHIHKLQKTIGSFGNDFRNNCIIEKLVIHLSHIDINVAGKATRGPFILPKKLKSLIIVSESTLDYCDNNVNELLNLFTFPDIIDNIEIDLSCDKYYKNNFIAALKKQGVIIGNC
jgi:hypothetical protein